MTKFKKVIVDQIKSIPKVKKSKRSKKRIIKKNGKKKQSNQLNVFKKLAKLYGKKIKNIKGKWTSL